MSIRLDNSTDIASRTPFDAQAQSCPTNPPIQKRLGNGPAQLSFTQERIWFLDQLAPGDVLFNLSQGVRVRGPLDVAALQKSLSAVIERHEILRTTFAKSEHHANTDGRPRQLIASRGYVQLELIELPANVGREEQARNIARAEARKPFDLTLGPLLRALLVRLDHDDYVLLLSTHRIVADEVSLGLIFQELWDGGLFVGQVAGLSAAAGWQPAVQEEESQLQFADYSEWERDRFRDEAGKECINWWRDNLSGAPVVLELPTDRPRPALQTSSGDSCELELDERATCLLRNLSTNAEATISDVVLAALQILLARYSGQTDIVVGLASINRSAETDGLIGPLADSLVARGDLSGNPTFNELLSDVKNVVREAGEHDVVPFARLLEELSIERSLSHAPVFQVMMKVERGTGMLPVWHDMGEMPMPQPFQCEMGIAAYDLSLQLNETPEHLKLKLEYNTDLFDRSTARRMLGHLESILIAAVSNPTTTIHSINFLTADETQQLLDWNRTAVSYGQGSVIDLFERQVRRSPSAEALIFETQSLTYEELNERANRLAHHLRKLGVGPDSRVAVCFERTVEMVISVLASLKAGGAYVPLDPKYPADRLRFMLADAKCAVVLTSSALAKQLPETSVTVLHVDALIPTLSSEGTENLHVEIQPENLAYVIYTSGSTGWPKGVAMTHGALANVINWQLDQAFVPRRTLQFSSLSFDVSFQELFSTWGSGGALVLVSDDVRADAKAMLRFLKEQEVGRLFLPFVYLQHLAEAADTDELVPADLREVITAGEQLE